MLSSVPLNTWSGRSKCFYSLSVSESQWPILKFSIHLLRAIPEWQNQTDCHTNLVSRSKLDSGNLFS